MHEIIERQIVWHGKFLKCINITYRDSLGSIRKWETFDRVGCDGVVAIVPVTDKGEAIVIRQFRPAVNRHVIEFPAGLNDKGESLEAAAKRELLEETGYAAGEMIPLAEGPVSSGASGEILTVYLAKRVEHIGASRKDETEDIEVFKIPVQELYSRLNSFSMQGDYIDLKVFGLMELAKKYL